MVNSYKLTEEIKQFIITQKKTDSNISCRGLVALIEKTFAVKLSKSLVNNVIKVYNLSSPVGRKRIKESSIVSQPIEVQSVKKVKEFMENGGYFFLIAADIKFSLTVQLAQNFSIYFPDLSPDNLQALLQTIIFTPLFKDIESLWLLIGKEIPPDTFTRFSKQLSDIKFSGSERIIMKLGIDYKSNIIKELHNQSLLRLNNYVQSNFFPRAYQFLDFSGMVERFYSLSAKIEEKEGLLKVHFFYPEEFLWKDDVVWQEDLAYAANKVNESQVYTEKRECLWINPRPEVLPSIF